MSDYYWLAETQLERIKSYFPRAYGSPLKKSGSKKNFCVKQLETGLGKKESAN